MFTGCCHNLNQENDKHHTENKKALLLDVLIVLAWLKYSEGIFAVNYFDTGIMIQRLLSNKQTQPFWRATRK